MFVNNLYYFHVFSNIGIYHLANLTGGGMLVPIMERALKSKNYDEIDRAIMEHLSDFLYDVNGLGEGKEVNLRYGLLWLR